MSTDADRAAAEKAEAEKKAAEDAATAAAANWPIGGYNSFIPLLFITVLAILALCVDVCTVSVVCACMIEYQHVINSVNAMIMIMIYSWFKLIEKLPIFSTATTSTNVFMINFYKPQKHLVFTSFSERN